MSGATLLAPEAGAADALLRLPAGLGFQPGPALVAPPGPAPQRRARAEAPLLDGIPDFDRPAPPRDTRGEAEVEAEAALAARLAAAEAEGYRAGEAAGRAAAAADRAAAEAARAEAAALGACAAAIEAASTEAATAAARAAEALGGAVLVALQAALPAAAARLAPETAAMIAQAARPLLARLGRLTLAVAPGLGAAVRARLDDPRIAVTEDPALPPGEVRAGWAQGLPAFDLAEQQRAIRTILAACGFAGAELPPDPDGADDPAASRPEEPAA